MRNLKKVLSLALALVMLLGMMVVGAGAVETKFVDDGKIGDSYKEAVAVMSAIKVLGGKENNNFDPKGTLTRAEAAKILCVMTMGSDAAEGLASVTKSGVFTDMPDHWAAGYVDACYNKGIVLGMAQGIYGPSNTLTGTQFAAMLLRAMGVEGEFTGPSWESAVIAAAGKAKLSEVTTKPIAREAASKMAFDGLLYSPSGEKAYKVGNLTFDNFLEAYIAADQDVEKITVSTASDSLATTVFGLAEDAKTDAFGNPVKVWVYDDEDVVTLPGAAATLTFTKKMSASDLDKYTYADEAKLFVDGKEIALKGTNAANDTKVVDESGNGIEVNVYATNKVISKVVAVKDYVDTVSAVTPARGDKERTITVGSLTYKTEEFEKGDVVLYTKAYNAESKKYEIKTVALAETMENVKVTSAKLDGDNHVVSFSVDGEDYDFSAVSVPVNKDDANLNNIVTLYLDSHGFVGKVEKVEGTSSDAYVLDIGHKSAVYGSDATYYAKLLLTDGTVVSQAELHADNVDAAKATEDNSGNHPSAPADIVAVLKGTTTSTGYDGTSHTAQLMGKVVSFTETDDVYKLDAGTNKALGNYVASTTANDGKVEVNNGKSAMTLGDGTLYANSNTIFLVKTGNSYASYTGFDEVPNLKNTTTDAIKNGKFAYSATSNVVSVIYLEGVQSETSDVVFLLGAGCDTSATKDSDGTYYNCKAVVNGEITSVKLKSNLAKGTNKLLNSVVQDKNGIIDVGASTEITGAGNVVASKNVTKALEGGVITINSTPYVVAEDATAYVCGTDIQGSDVGAIVKDDTVIFAVIKDGQVTTVFYTEKDESNQGNQGGDSETETGATVNPTGATINEDTATIAVDFVHGGKSADRIAQEKLVASGWKIVSGSLNTTAKTVKATKDDGIEVQFTYTPTEYFTVKVDNTTYYVTGDGYIKGESTEYQLPLNANTYPSAQHGTGYLKGNNVYAAYAATTTKVGIKTAAMGSDTAITGNKEIKTGYVSFTAGSGTDAGSLMTLSYEINGTAMTSAALGTQGGIPVDATVKIVLTAKAAISNATYTDTPFSVKFNDAYQSAAVSANASKFTVPATGAANNTVASTVTDTSDTSLLPKDATISATYKAAKADFTATDYTVTKAA